MHITTAMAAGILVLCTSANAQRPTGGFATLSGVRESSQRRLSKIIRWQGAIRLPTAV